MNKRIAQIYVVVESGRVLYADTNLKHLHTNLSSIAPDISYIMLYNSFRENHSFERSSKNGRSFSFQVIENKDFVKT